MDLKLGPDGDLAVENNDLVIVTGLEAIAQHCRITLQFFLGEWFLDKRIGMPWFQKVLGKKQQTNVVSDILRQAILKVPGILSITSFDPSFDNATRVFSVSFRADTIEGPLDFSEEFIL